MVSYAVNASKVLHELKKPRDIYKKNHGGALPSFFTYMTAGEKKKGGNDTPMPEPPVTDTEPICDTEEGKASN